MTGGKALAFQGETGEDFAQLHAVVEVTAGVVVMNLLNEVGIPGRRLADALGTHAEFRSAVELALPHFSRAA